MKRFIALLMCLIVLASAFAGCSNKVDKDNPGAYISMYLTDPVYTVDPAFAYQNDSALKLTSLLFDTLFVMGDNGKVEKSLVKKYEIDKEENTMLITLRDDTFWSDGTAVSTNDVIFAWQRILDSSRSFDAAVLLYDIKNAKNCKEGNVPSVDDIGVQILNNTELLIEFEEGANYDNFMRNLTSVALAPLRSDVVGRTEKENDWAKGATSIVTSGPFRIKSLTYTADAEMVLERNAYYRRDYANDALDKAVTPYRIVVDYTMSDEDILSAYENGEIFYIGDIPFSVRSTYSLEEWEKKADISDSLSTHSYMINQNAVIRYYDASVFRTLSGSGSVFDDTLVEGKDGEKIFAITEVRQALSLAINRTSIAEAVVFAEPANGLVPNGVFETDSKKNTFRDNDSTGLSLTDDLAQAKKLLSDAKIDPSKFMFAISVPQYDDVQMEIAKMVQAAWGKSGLGFNVAINAIKVVDNKDKSLSTGAVITGVKDDIFAENYYDTKYEVAAVDYTALSTDAFSVLAPFATGFTGGASVLPNSNKFTVADHCTGYVSSAFNKKIKDAYAQDNLETRAELLHDAEDILMSDLPIIPIVYNKTVSMESKELSKIEYSYYGTPIFTKTKLKNYQDYLPEN